MGTEIIVGVLSLVGTLAGSYFAQRKSTALIAYRLEQLELQVHKHNCLVERMVAVEQSVKSAHHRLDGIEKKG
jgi:hypothetical protein